MLYLFHGSDVEKTRAKVFEWVAKARAKEPQLAYVRLAREELSGPVLEEVTASGGLFVQRMLVVLDEPFPPSRKDTDEEDDSTPEKNLIEEYLERLQASDNAIVLLAPKLALPKVKKITALAKMVYVFDRKAPAEAARGFNANLANALAARSREKLWLELQRALRKGDAPEALHGILHWKARDLMMKGSRSWTAAEARALSLTLLGLVQDSRRGGLDLRLALERFALSM